LGSNPPSVATAKYDPRRLIPQLEILISRFTALKAHAELGEFPRKTLGTVAAAYEEFETSLLSGPVETTTIAEIPADDPAPDVLRAELRRVVRACIKS
jgi:hypothetical protein